MVSPDCARFAIGIIGNIIALFLLLSPVPTFIRICKKGSVEQYSPTVYLVSFINCMFWTLYGLPFVHPNSILLTTISGCGCIIHFVYLLLFIYYSDKKKKKKKKRLILILVVLAEVVFTGITSTLVLTLTHTTKRRSQIIGFIGDILGVIMYASPLSVMKQVITTKSVEFMPLFVSVTTFATSVVWGLYAIHPFDLYLALPNALGCLFGLAQLILYATYYKSTKEQLAARKTAEKLELGLKDVVVINQEPNKMNGMQIDGDSTPKTNGK